MQKNSKIIIFNNFFSIVIVTLTEFILVRIAFDKRLRGKNQG